MSEASEATSAAKAAGRVSRVADVLRHGVRQMSAAVYAYVAFVMLVRFVAQVPFGPPVLENALVFASAALLATIVSGPWWASSFVGAFVALFDGTLLLLSPEQSGVGVALLGAALLSASGAAGSFVARRRRALSSESARAGAAVP